MLTVISKSVLFFYIISWSFAFSPTENEIDTDGNIHSNSKSPASLLKDEVDIINLLNVSPKDQGVSLIEGPIRNYPAYKFRLPYANVLLTNATNVTKTLNEPNDFTVVFLMRQQKNNIGTLLSVNSPGRLTPWFQIVSNSKTGILTVKYRLKGFNKIRQIDWGLPKHHRKSLMAAWTWISISFDWKNGIIRLDLDCQPSRFEIVKQRKSLAQFSIPADSLVYFGQEPGRKKKYLGSLQVMKVLPYVKEQRLWSCMQIGTNLSPELRKPFT